MLRKLVLVCLAPALALATETENLGLSILPREKAVTVDGKTDDWDLSGGIFICGDVENYRDQMGCWYHAMYDADNLYILVRWHDPTPMNNPGSTAGDHAWEGDCLQVRIILADGDRDQERCVHANAWHGRDGNHVIDLTYGRKFDQGNVRDAEEKGAKQAFLVWPDRQGYNQEFSLPWKLLAHDGQIPTAFPAAGGNLTMTVEPNFTTRAGKRLSIKGLFRPGVTPDRVFTFMASNTWGITTLEPAGPVTPRPLRLSDNRTLPVSMEDGIPTVDWSALNKGEEDVFAVAAIPIEMPADGFVSLNLFNADGQVVRQLLTANQFGKGRHGVAWDGLSTWSHSRPGTPLNPGTYQWRALWHTGIGLELRGWAHNAGRSPYDTPRGNWGGDQGNPCAAVAAGDRVLLGWAGSEAGQAVVCTDLQGNVVWRHKRGGFGGARHLAVLDDIVYVHDKQQNDSVLYRLTLGEGGYTPWSGSPEAALNLIPILQPFQPPASKNKPGLIGLCAAAGRLYVSFAEGNRVLMLAADTGKPLGSIAVPAPADIEVGPDGAVYVISSGTSVLRLSPDLADSATVTKGLAAAAGLAVDAAGQICVGLGDPQNQIQVFAPDGKALHRIGKPGGRPLVGAWESDGLRFPHALAVDRNGHLWVPEYDDHPRRVSVWNTTSGAFIRELFGPTHYGACGGSICPADPLIMVGHGCEWQLDPDTGRARCLAVIDRGAAHTSRFGTGSNGHMYLAFGGGWHGNSPVRIFERLGPAQWKLRTRIDPLEQAEGNHKKLAGARVWADANDDQTEQPDEVAEFEMDLGGWITGWYMPMAPSLTFYGCRYRITPTDYTACGAPVYDFSQAKPLPAPDDLARRGGMGAQRGMGNTAGTRVLYNGHYGVDHSDFPCYDVATGKLLWSYPSTYVGVHGGHRAPQPATGLIRTAYDIVGTARLPDPIGDIFVIPTDKGEWHILNGDGFYISRLFQGDPMLIRWPTAFTPGTRVDDTPPGMGGEDFGGSITLANDGQLYVQGGKTAFVNLRVTGLDTVKALCEGTVELTPDGVRRATLYRGDVLQRQALPAKAIVAFKTIAFTGDLRRDFGDGRFLPFGRKDSSGSGRAVLACDEKHLYVGWELRDATPWMNGATDPVRMYASGDTVDLQLSTNTAVRKSGDAQSGDLRLSIGNLRGTPTAVIYRPKHDQKKPRTFYSGVVREGYAVDYVAVTPDVVVKTKVDQKRQRTVVEAAVPWAILGIAAKPELALRGDVGATFGDDATSTDTALRTYWSNKATGLVNDEVFELKLDPRNWGDLVLDR